jgi:prepilin-type N-terminal cleavage/methylation domain-containing protein
MMTKKSRKTRRGFTLIEIMIAVLIIGILLSIATPNFVRARQSARAKSCVANLKRIEGAKEAFAMEGNRSASFSPSMAALAGPGLYLRSTPVCPSGGTYNPRNMSTSPTCSIGVGGAGAWDDHRLP